MVCGLSQSSPDAGEVKKAWHLLLQALLDNLIQTEYLVLAEKVLCEACLVLSHRAINFIFDSLEHDIGEHFLRNSSVILLLLLQYERPF